MAAFTLLTMMASTGVSWATDVTFSYEDYKGQGTQSSGSEYTMVKTDVSITNTKFFGNNDYAHFYANGTTTIEPANGVTITQIVLTATATGYNGYQSGGTITATAGSISGSSSSITVTWTGSASAAFTISNNKQIRWTSIVVTYSTGGSSTLTDSDLALTGAPITLNFDLYNNSDAQVINYTTSSTGAVTVSSSNYITTVVDESNKTITVTPVAVTPSAQTITVNQAADDTYAAGSVTFTVNVANSEPTPDYEWVLTDWSELTSEDVFVIVGNGTKAMGNYASSSNPKAVNVTITDGRITSNVTDTMMWNRSAVDGGYKLHPNGSTTTCLYNSSGTNLRVNGGTSNNTFTYVEYSNYKYLKVGDRYVCIYNNNNDWRAYTSSNVSSNATNTTFYKRQIASTDPYITASDVEIAYDATSGSFDFTLNNPVDGGQLSVEENVDWIEAAAINTSNGYSVTFETTVNQTATAREGIITLTYTYGDSQTATKAVTITQVGNPNVFDDIVDITGTGDYRVKGMVVATSSKGFIIGDGTGYVYTYLNAAPSYGIGVNLSISGTTSTNYGHVIQFTNAATIETVEETNYNGDPQPTVITEVPDYSEGNHLSTYLEFEGTLNKSGSNYEVKIGESKIRISYPTNDQVTELTALLNKTVRVHGFFTGISGSNGNSVFTVMMESVEEVVNTDPVITVTPATAQAFTYVVENGPSANQLFEVTGENLTSNDITVTVTENGAFEMISDDYTDYGYALTIASGYGFFVRMKAGLEVGTYTDNITISSEGADDVVIALTGTVTIPLYTWDLTTNSYSSASADTVVWSSDYAIMTNLKGSSSSPANNYLGGDGDYTHTRFYKNQILTISSNTGYTIDSVLINAISNYVDGFVDSTWTNATTSANGAEITVIPDNGNEPMSVIISKACRATAVTVYYEADNTPRITATDVEIGYSATSGEIEYTLVNPVEGGVLTASVPEGSWITLGTIGETVPFTCAANTAYTARTATITLTYTYGEESVNKDVTITQGAAPEPSITVAPDGYSGDWYAVTTDFSVTYENIEGEYVADLVQVAADGETPATYNWFDLDLTIGGQGTGFNEDYTMVYVSVAPNDGAERTGYFKIYVVTDEGEYYSNLVTITQTGYDGPVSVLYTYSRNGVEDDLSEAYAGNAIELDGSDDLDETFTFVGWTTDPNDVNNLLNAGEYYTIEDDVVFYAVYAKSVTIPYSGNNYVKVNTVEDGGTYLIVSESNNVAFDGSLETLDVGNNVIDVNIISNCVIAATAATDTCTFTISAIDDNTYSILSASGKYIGRTTDKNGLDVKTLEQDPLSNTIVFNGYNASIHGDYRYLRFNSSSGESNYRFRYYNETYGEDIQLYKYTEGSGVFTLSSYYTRVFMNETATANIEIVGPSVIPSGYTLTMGNYTLTNELGADKFIIEDGAQMPYYWYEVSGTMLKNITACDFSSNNNAGYYLITTPINGYAPSTENGFLTTNYDLYAYDATQDEEWRNYKANNFSLATNKGYLYASGENTTLQFAGILNVQGVYAYLNYDPDDELKSLTLFGNPYLYSTDFNLDGGGIGIGGPIINFLSLNDAGNGFITTSGYSYFAQPLEGFFVQAPEAGHYIADGATSLVPEEELAVGPGNLNIQIDHNNSLLDNAIVNFGNARMMRKFYLSNNSTRVYIPQGNKDFAVVRSANEGEMPVNFKAETNGNYTISVNAENVEMNYLHLIDNLTGADVDLLATPSYSFEANTNDYATRFRLVFKANANVHENADADADTFAFFNGNEWVVSNIGEATLQVVDVMGRVLSSETINGNAEISIKQEPGVYMLRLINGDNVKTQKVVVR